MTVRDRNSFSNLLLLCKPHHNQVDDKELESEFPRELLARWKSAREGGLATDLAELDWVTEGKLKGWMGEAVADTRDEITASFDRLQDFNREFLSSLRQAALDFFDLPYLDADDIRSLHYTATVFRSIPEYASKLDNSARELSHLPTSADILSLATPYLDGLSSSADLLNLAALAINDAGLPAFVSHATEIESSVRSLTDASSDLRTAAELVGPVPEAAAQIREASARLEHAASVLRARRSWSWKEFWWGTASCAGFVIAVLILWSHIATH